MRTVAILAILASSTRPNRAADVLVIGPDGAGVAEAAVLCAGSEGSPALTDSQGRASVPDACARVTCMSGRYLPGTVDLGSGPAKCRLAEGVRVVVALAPPGCGDGCSVSLVPEARGTEPVHREVREDPQTGGSAARLPLVPPGAYAVWIFGAGHWICQRRIELSSTGESLVSGVWRGPTLLRGVVLGPTGLPLPDMPVRAVSKKARAEAWSCAIDTYVPDVFTAPDGTFELPVDLESTSAVEAGSSWDPDGFGTAAISLPLGEPLVVRVSVPKR